MFKDSKIEFSDDTIVITDSGYQGLQKIHEKTLTPIKKSKNILLNAKGKDFNKFISKIRVPVEHVFGWLKRFKILVHACRKSKYRMGLNYNFKTFIVSIDKLRNVMNYILSLYYQKDEL